MRRWLDRNGKGEAGVGSKWRGGGSLLANSVVLRFLFIYRISEGQSHVAYPIGPRLKHQ